MNRLLADPEVVADHFRLADLGRERSQLDGTVTLIRQFRAADEALSDARALMRDGDAEERELGHEEEIRLATEVERLEEELKVALLPRDPADDKDVIVEIRGGTGGEEAALFAADLFRIYQRYAERQGWKAEVLSASDASAGGYKEIIFELHGQGAYSRMKYESGVHRVQRVPETESQGRVHTSTATVAVLPVVEDIDIEIDWSEVRIDIFHSGGAGGQNVNKVATAVRMTHEPSNIVVVMQDERSQAKNRVKAEAVLRARLYQMEREKADAELAANRKSQVGTGNRAEKIRTYNFPQDRITDHRVGLTIHGMARILDGDIDELIDAVALDEQTRLLQAAV